MVACVYFMVIMVFGAKKVLDKIGPQEEYYYGSLVVTEDLSMSIRAALAGFYGKTVWLESGEWVPASLKETEAMWHRWAFGSIQVLCKTFLSVLKSRQISLIKKIDILQQNNGCLMALLFPLLLFVSVLFPRNPSLVITANCINVIPTFFLIGYVLRNRKGIYCKYNYFEMYCALFVIDTFIMWVQARALWLFFRKKPHGWKPTMKGTEDIPKFQESLYCQKWLILFAIIMIVIILYNLFSGIANNYFYALSLIFSGKLVARSDRIWLVKNGA